jgi:hypothetical protein
MAGTSGRVVWSSALGIVALLLFSGLALAEPVIQPYSHGMALGNGFNIYGAIKSSRGNQAFRMVLGSRGVQ